MDEKISVIDKSFGVILLMKQKTGVLKRRILKKLRNLKQVEKTMQDWEWLKDFVEIQITKKNIAPKNIHGEPMNHQSLIETWKRII